MKIIIVKVKILIHPPSQYFSQHYHHEDTHLQEATTSTHSPTPTGREIQPLDLVYQFLSEGSIYPMKKFTSYQWKEALTPLLKATTLSASHGPCFIIFHTRSTCIKYTSKHAGHLLSNFHTGPTPNIMFNNS